MTAGQIDSAGQRRVTSRDSWAHLDHPSSGEVALSLGVRSHPLPPPRMVRGEAEGQPPPDSPSRPAADESLRCHKPANIQTRL